jgi:hypothetical protein
MTFTFQRLFACPLALALTLAMASGLAARDSGLESVTKEQMSKEGPLTQRDVNVFLSFLEENRAIRESGRPSDDDYGNFARDFMRKNNVTPVRLKYLLEKVLVVVAVVENGDDVLSPGRGPTVTNSEKKVVKANLAKIIDAIQKSR